MLKRIGIGFLVLLIFLLMLWFTDMNPGVITLDLAFDTVEPSIPQAFAVTFVFGWLFGLLCTSVVIFRLSHERRRLRRALRNSEFEVSSLRNLPLADAD